MLSNRSASPARATVTRGVNWQPTTSMTCVLRPRGRELRVDLRPSGTGSCGRRRPGGATRRRSRCPASSGRSMDVVEEQPAAVGEAALGVLHEPVGLGDLARFGTSRSSGNTTRPGHRDPLARGAGAGAATTATGSAVRQGSRAAGRCPRSARSRAASPPRSSTPTAAASSPRTALPSPAAASASTRGDGRFSERRAGGGFSKLRRERRPPRTARARRRTGPRKGSRRGG